MSKRWEPGIAGQVVQLLELTENGQIDRGAEDAFEIGQRSDPAAKQELLECGARESGVLIML